MSKIAIILTLLYSLSPLSFGQTAKSYFAKAQKASNPNSKIKYYTLALETDKKFTSVYLNRGIVFIKTKEYEKAAADFKKVIEVAPSNEKPYFYLGLCRYRQEKYDEAASAFSKNINRNKNSFRGHYYRARSLHKAGLLKAALSDFQKAMDLKKDTAYLYHHRAAVHMDDKNYKEALADFTKAIQLDATDPIVRKNRGCLNLRIKKFADAKQDLDNALLMQKSFPSAYICMAGYWWMSKKNTAKALDNLELAFKYGFKDFNSLYDEEAEGRYFKKLVDNAQFRYLVNKGSAAK